ncbi:MAG: MipA/OmpV family protein [Rhizobiaceae bacterium]|nr:MipA/OmpV family protein [Rhizobiaceae bacterium]
MGRSIVRPGDRPRLFVDCLCLGRLHGRVLLRYARPSRAVGGVPASFRCRCRLQECQPGTRSDYRLTDRWTATSKIGYSYLLGDAADSPVTASRSQWSGGLGLTYTFGRVR